MASPRLGKLEMRVRRILDSGRKMGRWLRLADRGLCAVLAVALIACTACKPVTRMIKESASSLGAEAAKRLGAQAFPGDL